MGEIAIYDVLLLNRSNDSRLPVVYIAIMLLVLRARLTAVVKVLRVGYLTF